MQSLFSSSFRWLYCFISFGLDGSSVTARLPVLSFESSWMLLLVLG